VKEKAKEQAKELERAKDEVGISYGASYGCSSSCFSAGGSAGFWDTGSSTSCHGPHVSTVSMTSSPFLTDTCGSATCAAAASGTETLFADQEKKSHVVTDAV